MINNSPKKLLYLMHEPDYFFMHWLHIALNAVKQGFEVHLAAPPRGRYAEVERHRIIFHPIYMNRREGLPWQEIRSILDSYRVIKQIQPDIVHTIAVKSILYGGIAARMASARSMINAFTGLGYVYTSDSVKAKIMQSIISKGYKYIFKHNRCKVTFQNNDDLEFMVETGILERYKSVLIRGAGVDINKFSVTDEQPGKIVVAVPSRMLWDKGIQEFVDAATLLKNDGIDARFVLIGDSDTGNPTSIPKETLNDWHNKGIIEWWGHQNDMPSIYAQSHIVCLPSYREGLPTVLCEASSCGRPLVTTDVPGCREVVQNSVNGIVVPVKNSKALASAMRQLITNPTLRKDMGTRGRKIAVNNFSIETIVTRTLSLYCELTQ